MRTSPHPTAARSKNGLGFILVLRELKKVTKTLTGSSMRDKPSPRRKRRLPVLETSHPPVYYFPPNDCKLEWMPAAGGGSFAKWKGSARYDGFWSCPAATRLQVALVLEIATRHQRFAANCIGSLAFYGVKTRRVLRRESELATTSTTGRILRAAGYLRPRRPLQKARPFDGMVSPYDPMPFPG